MKTFVQSLLTVFYSFTGPLHPPFTGQERYMPPYFIFMYDGALPYIECKDKTFLLEYSIEVISRVFLV